MARTLAFAVILLAAPAAFAAPPGPGSPAPRPRPGQEAARQVPREGERRLDEVRITGTPEAPDVLFFLPHARFRLLPPLPEKDWKERLAADSAGLEKAPR